MLATVGGSLALLLGVLAMLLPLLATELSRPRDAFWGAVVLLLGLVLVTSSDRLTGAPMLAVLCGGLLIGRLGSEVIQLRWSQLTAEEQARLGSTERWRTSSVELQAALGRLLSQLAAALQLIAGGLGRTLRPAPRSTGKRWVRPEKNARQSPPAEASSPGDAPAEAALAPAETAASTHSAEPEAPPVVEVNSFAEVDALVQQAIQPAEVQAPFPATGPLEPEAGPGAPADGGGGGDATVEEAP